MGLGIPPLEIKNLLESNPLKSRFLVCELTVLGSSTPHTSRLGPESKPRRSWISVRLRKVAALVRTAALVQKQEEPEGRLGNRPGPTRNQLMVSSRNFNLQKKRKWIEGSQSPNYCLCSLQNALWKFKSPCAWSRFSRLNFWQLTVLVSGWITSNSTSERFVSENRRSKPSTTNIKIECGQSTNKESESSGLWLK